MDCNGSHAAPVEPAPIVEQVEWGGSNFGYDDHNPLPVEVPEVERTKEEELALALKEFMDTTLEEQAVGPASIYFDDVPVSFIFS